jgi:integrase/recombinase XerC
MNSSNSINRKISSLKSFYKYLLKEKIVDINPVEKIIRLKTKKKLPEFLSNQDTDNLLGEELFEDNFEGYRDKLIVEILYCTGIRREELINLKTRDIDTEKKTIKVTGKRNKQRIIPYPSGLDETILKYRDELYALNFNSEFLIITKKGEKAYPNLIYRIVKKYISSISTLSKTSPHILRHTYATQMLNNGADINAVKELLGHANLSATQIYTHNTFEKLTKIYKQAHPRAQK